MKGLTVQDSNPWEFDLSISEQESLNLPQPVIDKICQFLPTQRDLYEACLINRTWREAATAVLWRSPQLRDPERFKQFYNCCRMSKRAALSVREISLCIQDAVVKTVFLPIAKADLPRHDMKTNMLSHPDLVQAYARQCEQLTSITMYGWRLQPSHLEQLAVMLNRLTSIELIGSNPNPSQPFALSIILPRLERLILDGRFWLTPHFLGLFSSRATRLRVLQISLADMEEECLRRLCTGRLDLHELTLTDAVPITDIIVRRVVQAFPNLRKLCLTGCNKVTDESILHALISCPHLRDLEIRALPATLQQRPDQKLTGLDLAAGWNTVRHKIVLQRLVLENWGMNDEFMTRMAGKCTRLTTLGLSNCPNLTDRSIVNCLGEGCRLHVFNTIRCPGLGSDTWAHLKHGKGLRRIYVELCGELSPKDAYDICCSCPNLRILDIEGYPEVANCIHRQLAHGEDAASFPDQSLSLNANGIRALANIDPTTDPKLTGLPETRYLTGEHVMHLAKALGIPIAEFEALLDMVQSDVPAASENIKSLTQQVPATLRDFSLADKRPKSLQRINQLKEPHQQRPATPALWAHANDAMMEHYLPGINKGSALATAKMPSPIGETISSIAQEQESDETSVERLGDSESSLSERSLSPTNGAAEIYKEEQTVKEDWPVLGGQKEKEKPIDLGGWGTTNNFLWKTGTSSSRPSGPVTKGYSAWDPNEAINRTREWQQKPLEQALPPARRRGQPTAPQMMLDSDGWGQPKSYVAWHDLRTQGFAHDVIEKQRDTPFWNAEIGAWSTGAENVVTTEAAAPKKTMEKANESWSKYQRPSKGSGKQSAPSMTRQRATSAADLSSDESVNWDEDDGVTIKTSTKPTIKPGEKTKSNGSLVAPNHPGDPKWRNTKEWHKLREQGSMQHPNAEKNNRFEVDGEDGWSEESDLLSDDTPERATGTNGIAKNVTSKFGQSTKQSTPMTSPRPSLREPIAPEELAGAWGAFTVAETSSEMLIDTSDIVNKPSSISQDTLIPKTSSPTYNDFWQSMSSLTKVDWNAGEEKSQDSEKAKQIVKEETYNFSDIQDTSDIPKETKEEMMSPIQPEVLSERVLSPIEPLQPIQSPAINSAASNNASPTMSPAVSDSPRPASQATNQAASPVPPSSSNDSDPGPLIVQLYIETTKHGMKPLKLYDNRDPEVDVENYCKQYDMMEVMPRVLEAAMEHYTRNKTKRILGKKKKAKEKSAISSSPASNTLI
ncbi:hypothetical protein EC973_005611 [Apophysomyces ossiformis]|uniref:F-box domain-containing protein n=1 Tax=Apophysomyces ossiformis TaxID=679940 RepID=A0A8H7BUB2_9FUNG|nr:hypothetical protein EC973_005611 [Apophysomyces ossiformis]